MGKLIAIFINPHFGSYRLYFAKHFNYSIPSHFWTGHLNLAVNSKSGEGELHRNKANLFGLPKGSFESCR